MGAELLVVEDSMKSLQWEHEVLLQRYGSLEKERDELYDKFQSSVYEVQQKSGFKNLLLEKQLSGIGEALEKKEAQLNEVLVNENLAPNGSGDGSQKMEDIIEGKNQTVRDLQQELERVVRAYNDTLRQYQGKLTEYGIPHEELGFKPSFERMPMRPQS